VLFHYFRSMKQNEIVVITGVSKGIGLAAARLLCEKGYTVAGWGRNQPDFRDLNFHFFKCDVSDARQVASAVQQTRTRLGENIYGLINNAGFGHFGKVEELALEKWHEMFNTNVHGLMYCIREVVPFLKAKQRGHIINISSIAGLNGIVQGSGYSATKFAVRGISHSLYAELREDGIKVSCVYPGSVATNFFDAVEGITISPNMLQADDVATLLLQLLQSPPNFLTVDVEIRPLQPKGKTPK
jgi:NADP-dependent 3-hydroxy acid dehydrogenase YdfG